jgi:hypothetical protein
MAQLKQGDMRTPFGGKGSARLRGRIDRLTFNQAAAASGNDIQVSDAAGKIQDIYIITAATPGAGESLTVDVQKNGVTVLTTPLVVDNTRTGKTVHRPSVAALGASAALGDIFTVVRTYAAGAPAPVGPNKVVIEIG